MNDRLARQTTLRQSHERDRRLLDTMPQCIWAADAEKELRKIPFFVRGKARRNTERFANENGLATITIETLYDAKAHYAR